MTADHENPAQDHGGIVDRALAQCPRDDDGNVDESVLRKIVAEMIEIDLDTERERRAKKLISDRTKIGSTATDGQIQLFDSYPYEPSRLIRDNNGNVVEQHRASLQTKQDEASRKRLNANRANRQADISQVEAERFAAWIVDQAEKGRPKAERTFGVFVKESGIWAADTIESEAS